MIKNRTDFYNSLSEREQENGLLRFYIPEDDQEKYINGEHVWGWADETEIKKYREGTYSGTMTAILLNSPVNFMGKLRAGDEVVIHVYANDRSAELDEDWIAKELGKTYTK